MVALYVLTITFLPLLIALGVLAAAVHFSSLALYALAGLFLLGSVWWVWRCVTAEWG